MNNRQTDIKSLLADYAAGLTSGEEAKQLFAMIANSEFDKEVKDVLLQTLEQTEISATYDQERWDFVFNKIRSVTSRPEVKKKFIWYRIAAVASVILVLGIGFYFYNSWSYHIKSNLNLTQSSDIAPGSNKAYLTLANGKVIALSEAKTGVVIDANKLTYNDGSELRVSSRTESLSLANKQLTTTTPRGGTYQIVLSDGTRVYLNAASSLKFPPSFAGLKERKVELNGEAYFVVKHDAKYPFRVQTAGQIVEDIGTEFNINAYRDEITVKTTLVEGAARVVSTFPVRSPHSPELDSGSWTNNSIVLKPNQQSSLTKGTIKVAAVNIENEIAWKDGLFRFQSADLVSIMRRLARWYNLEVSYEGQSSTRTFNGVIKRDVNLSQILKILETGGIKFKIMKPLNAGGIKRIVVIQ